MIKQRFVNFIKEKKLINKGDGIVIGLSGGPDSVCLLNLLIKIREEFNLGLAAAHINHMLRGEEADKDEEYCLNICKELGVDFFSKKIDINEYSKKSGMSSEEAGREVRYDFFNEVMNKKGFNKIATAHNANDQAETILMRMMRGTGLEGLSGIPVIRDNRYIRPILFMKREEVERYCEDINSNPRIDKSNLERIYSRNKVRLDILPYMKENFNSDIVEAINRMGFLLQEDNEYILSKAEEEYKKKCQFKNNCVLIIQEVFALENSIKKRVIRKAIKEVSGNKYDVEMKHIEDVVDLAFNTSGKQINLPNGIIAINEYGNIKLKLIEEKPIEKDKEICLLKKEVLHNTINFNDYHIKFKVVEAKKTIEYSKEPLIKYFDFDKINGNIVIRYRKNGDKIIPLGLKGSKKVKDIFIDMKIPKEDRDLIPILEFDENISWIIGVKLSDKYKINSNTRKILIVEFCLRKGN